MEAGSGDRISGGILETAPSSESARSIPPLKTESRLEQGGRLVAFGGLTAFWLLRFNLGVFGMAHADERNWSRTL
jgi:hypothetical protein